MERFNMAKRQSSGPWLFTTCIFGLLLVAHFNQAAVAATTPTTVCSTCIYWGIAPSSDNAAPTSFNLTRQTCTALEVGISTGLNSELAKLGRVQTPFKPDVTRCSALETSVCGAFYYSDEQDKVTFESWLLDFFMRWLLSTSWMCTKDTEGYGFRMYTENTNCPIVYRMHGCDLGSVNVEA